MILNAITVCVVVFPWLLFPNDWSDVRQVYGITIFSFLQTYCTQKLH